jgi:threonine-phosphate decarboxylase
MNESLPIHGGQLQALAERFNIPVSQLVDFSANTNPEGPPPAVLSTLRASLDDISILTSYPDLRENDLAQSVARYAGVSPQRVVVANGFVPLLEAILRILPIRSCLLPIPAFVEYRKSLARAQVAITPLQLTPESNFAYDIDTMTHGEPDAILLANPQNPSGVLCDLETMLRLIRNAAEKNIYVLLDEAFIDYAPDQSLVTHIDRFPNLIVFRSVTKFHGIPGLRVAYAVTNPLIAQKFRESLAPWPITSLASRAVVAALEDDEYAARTRELNQRRRAELQLQIETLGMHVYPSAANFLLFRLPSSIDPLGFWGRLIEEHRVVLRFCANYEGLSPRHFRVAVKTDRENTYLIQNAFLAIL